MITKDEIDSKARDLEIHPSNVQRDYVYGWVLMGIYSASPLKDLLVLKGGNAFRKGYFESTRFSGDLDFGTESAVESEYLRDELNKVCEFIQSNAGVVFELERSRVEEKFRATDDRTARDQKILHARLYFRDFYGKADHIIISVRMDVTQFDRLYAPVQERQLIHPYSDSVKCRTAIRCVKLEELLATKIKCLLQRQHSFDLFDLVYPIFVNNDLEVDKGEIVSIFLERTIFEPSPGGVKGLLLGLPLEIFRRFWNEELVCPRPSLFEFDQAVEWFGQLADDLFGRFPVTRQAELTYFSPEHRNTILEAGRTQTLLRLRYHGMIREVEAYALKYKKAQGQPAREYFYAFDRTGGLSKNISIKSFLERDVQGLENTETGFEPRYEIEVCKAGEPGEKSYFSRPFPGRRRRGPNRPKMRTGITYIIECSYCNKRFKRSRYTTKLNKHTDHYGNQCFGRVGILVDQDVG